MKREDWEQFGFGFGTAVVLGLAAWGAVELTKKIVAKYKDKPCPCGCEDEDDGYGEDDGRECCDDDGCEDGCCEDEGGDCCCEDESTDKECSDDIVEKSVNAQDEVLSPEFGN